MSSITTSGLKSFTLASVLAIGTTVSFSAVANAASWGTSKVPGDFSAAVYPNNVYTFWVDDCYVEVGVVFDWTPSPNYMHVGGVRIRCWSMHPVIGASVALYYWSGSAAVQYRDRNWGSLTNSYGFGNAIMYTPRYCVNSGLSPADAAKFYWQVGVIVVTEHTTVTRYSYWAHDPTGGGC